MNPDSGLTFNMVEEMCETKLLYIGENLFGVLRRLPLNRPITPPLVLPDVQASRLLTRDPSYNIHLTIIGVTRQQQPNPQPFTANDTDSPLDSTMVNLQSSIGSIVDTSAENNKPVKTKLATDNLVPLDIFGDAYAALIATPKVEPEEEHTSNAASNTQHFNLQISDVHTIGTIIKDEPLDNTQIITIDPHCMLHGINANTNVDTLQEATACKTTTPAGDCNTSPVLSESPLPEATSTHIESIQEPTSLSVNTPVNMDEASFVVPWSSESTLPEATSLHEATLIIPSASNTYYQEATDKDTSKTLSLMNTSIPSASVPDSTIDSSLGLPDQDYHELLISSNLTPTEKDPPEHVTVKTPPYLKNKESDQNLEVIKQPIDLSSNAQAIKSDMYYSIFTFEQDDIIHLHHKDIVNCTCSVKVDKLSQTDVRLACVALCQPAPSLDKPSGEPTIKDIDIDPDWPVKKQKKRST